MVQKLANRRIGRVVISEELLLNILDFEGGALLGVTLEDREGRTYALTIQHPDMPEHREGTQVSQVELTYTQEDVEIRPGLYRQTTRRVRPNGRA